MWNTSHFRPAFGAAIVGLFFLHPTEKNLTCKDFRTGTFELLAADSQSVHRIVRTSRTQVEYVGERHETSLQIRWLDDCHYILFAPYSRKRSDWSENKHDTLRCEILSIEGRGCVVRASMPGVAYTQESRIRKIR